MVDRFTLRTIRNIKRRRLYNNNDKKLKNKLNKEKSKTIKESKSDLWKELKKLDKNTSLKWNTSSKVLLKDEVDFIKFLKTPKKDNKIKVSLEKLNNSNIFTRNIKNLILDKDYLLKLEYTLDNKKHIKTLSNFDKLKEMEDLFTRGYIEKQENQQGSDMVNILNLLTLGEDVNFSWIPKSHTKGSKARKINSGAYFSYFNKTEYDLSRYQIFKQDQYTENPENCLIHTLRLNGVDEDTLNQIKRELNINLVSVLNLTKLMKKHNLNYELLYKDIKFDRNRKNIKINNEEDDKIIKIGLVNNHYFINEDLKVNIQDFNKEVRIRKTIKTSYDLIKYLFEKNDNNQYLIPISMENIKNLEHFRKLEEYTDLRNPNDKEYKDVSKLTIKKPFSYHGKDDDYNPNNNFEVVFADIETYYDKDKKYQVPYCLVTISRDNNIQVFYGIDCVKNYLDSINKHTMLIFHNLRFDFSAFIDYLDGRISNYISVGTQLKNIQTYYNNHFIVFKDNRNFLNMKLKDLPSMFNLDSGDKDVFPYDLMNKDNIDKLIPLGECLHNLNKKDNEQSTSLIENDFIINCNKKECISLINGIQYVDIKKYTTEYCIQDVKILRASYEKFRNLVFKLTKDELDYSCKKDLGDNYYGLDIDNYLSIPALASDYFKINKCYDNLYALSGISSDFIRKCIVGGRCMTNQNKKIHTKTPLEDLDANSLYPSAIAFYDTHLQGLPKVLTEEHFNKLYNNLDLFDGYFVEIKAISINQERDFPVLSYKDENHVRNFSNDVKDRTYYVDKLTLQEAVKYQGLKFEFIRGYYFNEGFNNKCKEFIKEVYNKRIMYKQQKNPIQNVLKLLMNSYYGKMIQKPIQEDYVFVKKEQHENYIISICDRHIESTEINDYFYMVKNKKSILCEYSIPHVGCMILSASKAIMNKVMYLAEDNDIKVYYQDTDSTHIPYDKSELLANLYRDKYNQELIGSNLGQFSSDFDIKKANKNFEVKAVEAIFLGKKAYIDKIQYRDIEDNKIKYHYHCRLKGIPNILIDEVEDKIKLYKDLYDSKKIKFDLSKVCLFDNGKDFKIRNKKSFIREISFNNQQS